MFATFEVVFSQCPLVYDFTSVQSWYIGKCRRMKTVFFAVVGSTTLRLKDGRMNRWFAATLSLYVRCEHHHHICKI